MVATRWQRNAIREKWLAYVEGTSMHGLPNIYSRPTWVRKLLYIIAFLASAVALGLNSHGIVSEFFSYPTETTVRIETQTFLPFPAVTICNLNPIRNGILQKPFENDLTMERLRIVMRCALGICNEKEAVEYEQAMSASEQAALFEHFDESFGGKCYDCEDWYNWNEWDYSYEWNSNAWNSNEWNEDEDEDEDDSDRRRRRETKVETTKDDIKLKNVETETIRGRRKRRFSNMEQYHYNEYDWYDSWEYDSWNYWHDDYYDTWMSESTWGSWYENDDAVENMVGVVNMFAEEDSLKDNEETTVRKKFMEAMYNLPQEAKIKFGHQIEDLMIKCSFGGKDCNTTDFRVISNPRYGNCFQFNVANVNYTGTVNDWNKNHRKFVLKPGPMNGLTLELLIEQDHYVSSIADMAGAKVVVHDPWVVPFPEDEGYRVTPGLATSIGLSQLKISRAEPPHGRCRQISEADNKKLNIYNQFLNQHIKYSQAACQRTCYQRQVINSCQCADPSVPATNFRFYGRTNIIPKCQNNTAFENCLKTQYRHFLLNMMNCTQVERSTSTICPPRCIDYMYRAILSSAVWPSDKNIGPIVKRLRSHSTETRDRLIDIMQASKKFSSSLSNTIYFENTIWQTYYWDCVFANWDIAGSSDTACEKRATYYLSCIDPIMTNYDMYDTKERTTLLSNCQAASSNSDIVEDFEYSDFEYDASDFDNIDFSAWYEIYEGGVVFHENGEVDSTSPPTIRKKRAVSDDVHMSDDRDNKKDTSGQAKSRKKREDSKESEDYMTDVKWSEDQKRSLETEHLLSFLRRNVAKVDVYFVDLTSEHIAEKSSYGVGNLLGDLGGHMGLWLGLSVLSLAEVIELIADFFMIIMEGDKYSSKKRNTKHTDDDTDDPATISTGRLENGIAFRRTQPTGRPVNAWRPV